MREKARGKDRGEKRWNNKREKVDLDLPNSRSLGDSGGTAWPGLLILLLAHVEV